MKWWAVLAFVCAFAARAQDPKSTCTVEGQVLNALTGDPLAKAHLALLDMRPGGNAYAATTDSGGRFALKNVAAATYHLAADRNGYLHAEHGSRSLDRAGIPLVLRPGQELREIVIRMTPQGIIMGRILDEDGEPLANANVHLMRFVYVSGRRQLQHYQGENTNDLGEYRIFALPPGRYFMSANHPAGPDSALGQVGSEEAYAPTYYPGTFDPTSAGSIEISAGAQLRGIDLTLTRTRTVRVRGRVINAASAGGGRIILSLTRNDSVYRYMAANVTTVRDPQGIFELRGVTPGSYILTANTGEADHKLSAHMPLEVSDTNIENVSLLLAPGFDLTGHVGVEGTAKVRLTGLMVFLSGSDPATRTETLRALIRDKGEFTFQGLLPEHYQISVYLPENVYIKSIRLGTEDALESGLNLTRGASGPVEILVSSNGGTIDGTVLNAQQQPAAGATVVLVPESRLREQTRLYKWVAADTTGHSSVKGIAPGEYKLFAWEEVETGAYQDPDFLKPFENLGEAISIHEGSHENAQLKLIPDAK